MAESVRSLSNQELAQRLDTVWVGDDYEKMLLREAASRLAERTREDLRQPDDAMLTAQITKLTRYISERQDRGIECPDHVDVRTLLIEYRALLSTPPASPAATSGPEDEYLAATEPVQLFHGRWTRRPRVSAASRPAQTCATCKEVHAIAERVKKRETAMGFEDIDDLVKIAELTEPAAPRSVVAPEKE